MENIIAREPVDRLARLVTDQRDCVDELSTEQMRENLVAKVERLKDRCAAMTVKSPRRKAIGQEINKINRQINALRPKRKTPGLEKYIVDVIKEEISGCEFKRIYDLAFARMEEARSPQAIPLTQTKNV